MSFQRHLLLFFILILFPRLIRGTNVILFVGDGTGLAQLAAARIAAAGPDGRLAVDQLEHIAVVTTHSASGLTTDSAAGSTAWATGRKTNNGYLAVTPDRQSLKTILEYARDAGFGTGLVTTTTLTHATPAAFAAHIHDRGAQGRIARQMLATRPNVMLGGGRAFWIPKGQPGSKRKDLLDLREDARQAGYQVVESRGQLRQLDPAKSRYVLGLFARDQMTYTYDWEPFLAEMAGFAIDVLEGFEKDFFLLVEGGRVDHACHDNDATRAVWEALALDQAIARGIDFARRSPDTLILFVADHETGGMSVGNKFYKGFPDLPRTGPFPDRRVDLGQVLRIGWTTGGHTAIPVIAAAAGPGAQEIRGVLDNTDLFAIMMNTLGLEEGKP